MKRVLRYEMVRRDFGGISILDCLDTCPYAASRWLRPHHTNPASP
jgi:hypothetical protein